MPLYYYCHHWQVKLGSSNFKNVLWELYSLLLRLYQCNLNPVGIPIILYEFGVTKMKYYISQITTRSTQNYIHPILFSLWTFEVPFKRRLPAAASTALNPASWLRPLWAWAWVAVWQQQFQAIHQLWLVSYTWQIRDSERSGRTDKKEQRKIHFWVLLQIWINKCFNKGDKVKK